MRRAILAIATATIAIWTAGCQQDETPPPPGASIPPIGTYTQLRGDAPKPLPVQEPPMGAAGYADEPLVTQVAPEEPGFVDAYTHVGSPRMTLFINRTLEGKVIPTNRAERGVYLAPGDYDEVAARRIDYDAIENIMTDWFAAGGRVTMISPTLTEAQINALQHGSRNVLQELEKNDQIDVLIQVDAKATQQTPQGLSVRLIAEAINTTGGESIGRAVVDVPPPLDKPQINEYTRYLARKLMSDMTRTWSYPHPQRGGVAPTTEPAAAMPAPTTAP